jgi:hypothetical protein
VRDRSPPIRTRSSYVKRREADVGPHRRNAGNVCLHLGVDLMLSGESHVPADARRRRAKIRRDWVLLDSRSTANTQLDRWLARSSKARLGAAVGDANTVPPFALVRRASLAAIDCLNSATADSLNGHGRSA